jgi:hypothetical protein
MKSAMARLGDTMLGRILPKAEAGACGAGTGQKCKCGAPCGSSWCTQYYFGCTNDCVKSSTHC